MTFLELGVMVSGTTVLLYNFLKREAFDTISCTQLSGYAMLLMNTGKLDQAIEQFTDIIKVNHMPLLYILFNAIQCFIHV